MTSPEEQPPSQQPTTTTSSTNNASPFQTSNEPQSSLFESLSSYPFTTDPEFAKGLSIILGHPDSPASTDEVNRDDDLVLQAKCFYFSRKENLPSPLNPGDYRAWLKTRLNTENKNTTTTTAADTNSPSASHPHPHTSQPVSTAEPNQPHTAEPAYPSSFAHIVELITTGQPVPGIQEIPDTVLTGQDTASTKPARLKPWEKEDDPGATNDQ